MGVGSGGGVVLGGGVRVGVHGELKFLRKYTKKWGGGGRWGSGWWGVGQGGCERRIEVFVFL